jgi:predicted RNase H-like HicB family nuclease
MKFTTIIEQGENGWLLGQIKEVPAAISQAKTLMN